MNINIHEILEEFDYYMHKNFGKLPQEAYNKLRTTLTTLQSHHEEEVKKAREEIAKWCKKNQTNNGGVFGEWVNLNDLLSYLNNKE